MKTRLRSRSWASKSRVCKEIEFRRRQYGHNWSGVSSPGPPADSADLTSAFVVTDKARGNWLWNSTDL